MMQLYLLTKCEGSGLNVFPVSLAPAASQLASDPGGISGTRERDTTQNAGQLLTLTLPSIVCGKYQVIIISISFPSYSIEGRVELFA